jgi:nitroreductase
MGDSDNRPAELVRPLIRVRQVREFVETPINPDEMDALADVARWSGSSQNTQPWRLIAIRDIATIRQIARTAMPQSRALQTAAAAMAIVLPDDPGHAVSYAYDEGRVAERILIAVTLLGLVGGITWVAPQHRAAVGSFLGLPQDRFVRTVLAIGHPTEAARKPKSAPGQARLPRAEVVFEDRWPRD